jgi:hypothetical protein
MIRNVALAVLLGGAVALVSSASPAQDQSVLADLYGRGVHAYFSRDSVRAHDLLTQAIENGSRDPRAYYFRGLALRNLGREDDAKLDFQTGAQIEASGEDLTLGVSRSLERVQGPVRLELEGVRKLARLTARNERLDREERRYQQLLDAEREVLRTPGTPRPVRPRPELPEVDDTPGPFDGDAAPPAPAPPVESPEVDPAPEPMPVDDPFGEVDDPPAPPRPAPAPAPEIDADDPFGDVDAPPAPAVDADDPFGDVDDAPPPPRPAPAPAPAADGDDPFADPDAAAPPAPTPANDDDADADDPFAAPAAPVAPAPGIRPQPAPAPVAGGTGNTGSSIFRALGRAIFTDDGAEPAIGGAPRPAGNIRPVINLEDASDPFADDDDAAPAAPAPRPAAPATRPAPRPAPAPAPAADPFAEEEDPFAEP